MHTQNVIPSENAFVLLNHSSLHLTLKMNPSAIQINFNVMVVMCFYVSCGVFKSGGGLDKWTAFEKWDAFKK